MKTILITGAAGFIGRRISAAAQAAGWRVIGLGRCEPAAACGVGEGTGGSETVAPDGPHATVAAPQDLSPSDFTRSHSGSSGSWIVADLTSDTPIELPPGIDTIIHLAGKAHALAEVAQDEAEYFKINTEGTRRMLEAAQRVGVRAFVLFSTVKAMGEGGETGDWKPEAGNSDLGTRNVEGGPGREDCGNQGIGSESSIRVHRCSSVVPTPPDELCSAPPDTPYGQSKLAAERLVLAGNYVPHPVVLRPCLVYGPTPKGNLDKMIEAVKRGRFPPLPEVGNKRSMVHVDDVIAAALLAAEHPAAKGQVFIAADNEPFSTRQLFEWICTAAGRKVPRWTMPLWALRLLGRVGDFIGRLRGRRFVFDSDALAKLTGNAWYSSEKLQRELGWAPRHTLRETLPEILRTGA